ncbi:fatty acid desaturase family protein [Tamlana flava]|uniref:fatty acid desaturase family protein n=1 Tax=Tamlana flava TaxID=3158572 RepID=UPI00351AB6C6
MSSLYSEIKFNSDGRDGLMGELRAKVNTYFNQNNLSRKANREMVVKTLVILMLYVIPYFAIVFNAFTNAIIAFFSWIIMGIAMAGIGFIIGHDANHGNYSTKKRVNKALSHLMILIGGSSLVWRIQHNVLHHVYTNIPEQDEDLDVIPILRFSPDQNRMKIHRYQHYYAWLLYGLFTSSWATRKDFIKLSGYKSKDLLKTQNTKYIQALIFLIFSKTMYFIFFLGIPIAFSEQPWLFTIFGFLTMHIICGFIWSVTFQLSHKITEVSIDSPGKKGQINSNWAAHQLNTTANFATDSKLITWFTGGLNYQIEHHLFPDICHVHLRKISVLVKEITEKYDLPYYEKTFFGAIRSHQDFLIRLGSHDALETKLKINSSSV